MPLKKLASFFKKAPPSLQETPHPSRLPNLLILGFPKCGTHGLLRNMGHHPDIYTHPDEVKFFGRDKTSEDQYRNLFRSNAHYCGEKSPYYVLREKAMKEISQKTPDAKLIICLRHPIQMIHSFYNFRVFEYLNGYPPGINPEEYSFEQIVQDELNVEGVNIHQACYLKHIQKNVLSHFHKEQIYFVIQERMMAHMSREMNLLFKHLGLPPHSYDYETQIKQHLDDFSYPHINNQSTGYKKALEKLITFYREPTLQLYTFLNEEIPEWAEFDEKYQKDLSN